MSASSIVLAIIENSRGKIWVQQRKACQTYSNKWEFPGGKINPNETPIQALTREVYEEVGFNLKKLSSSNIKIKINFSNVLGRTQLKFFVFHVQLPKDGVFDRSLFGKEGQNGGWCYKNELINLDLLNTSKQLAKATYLNDIVWVTPDMNCTELAVHIEKYYKKGINQIILRQNLWSLSDWQTNLEVLDKLLKSKEIFISINSFYNNQICEFLSSSQKKTFKGVHLKSSQLNQDFKLLKENFLFVSASTHNKIEIDLAEQIEADFLTISPVLPTASHKHSNHLGWENFNKLVSYSNVFSFALGGIRARDLAKCKECGALGFVFMRGLE